jgi:hypothetical protein
MLHLDENGPNAWCQFLNNQPSTGSTIWLWNNLSLNPPAMPAGLFWEARRQDSSWWCCVQPSTAPNSWLKSFDMCCCSAIGDLPEISSHIVMDADSISASGMLLVACRAVSWSHAIMRSKMNWVTWHPRLSSPQWLATNQESTPVTPLRRRQTWMSQATQFHATFARADERSTEMFWSMAYGPTEQTVSLTSVSPIQMSSLTSPETQQRSWRCTNIVISPRLWSPQMDSSAGKHEP